MFTLTSIQNSDDEGSLGNRRAELVSLQSSGAESAGRLVVVLAVKKRSFCVDFDSAQSNFQDSRVL